MVSSLQQWKRKVWQNLPRQPRVAKRAKRRKGSGGSRPGTSTSVVSSVDGAEEDKDALRPLDRFLKPLRAKLELKSSIYLEPDTAVEKATILLEQAKDAKTRIYALHYCCGVLRC